MIDSNSILVLVMLFYDEKTQMQEITVYQDKQLFIIHKDNRQIYTTDNTADITKEVLSFISLNSFTIFSDIVEVSSVLINHPKLHQCRMFKTTENSAIFFSPDFNQKEIIDMLNIFLPRLIHKSRDSELTIEEQRIYYGGVKH